MKIKITESQFKRLFNLNNYNKLITEGPFNKIDDIIRGFNKIKKASPNQTLTVSDNLATIFGLTNKNIDNLIATIKNNKVISVEQAKVLYSEFSSLRPAITKMYYSDEVLRTNLLKYLKITQEGNPSKIKRAKEALKTQIPENEIDVIAASIKKLDDKTKVKPGDTEVRPGDTEVRPGDTEVDYVPPRITTKYVKENLERVIKNTFKKYRVDPADYEKEMGTWVDEMLRKKDVKKYIEDPTNSYSNFEDFSNEIIRKVEDWAGKQKLEEVKPFTDKIKDQIKKGRNKEPKELIKDIVYYVATSVAIGATVGALGDLLLHTLIEKEPGLYGWEAYTDKEDKQTIVDLLRTVKTKIIDGNNEIEITDGDVENNIGGELKIINYEKTDIRDKEGKLGEIFSFKFDPIYKPMIGGKFIDGLMYYHETNKQLYFKLPLPKKSTENSTEVNDNTEVKKEIENFKTFMNTKYQLSDSTKFTFDPKTKIYTANDPSTGTYGYTKNSDGTYTFKK